jgi:prevent-host-death family protein
MTLVTVHEAKTNLSKLIAEVLAGGDVVIARGAVPAVRLVAVDAPRKRRFGALRGKIAIDARFDEALPDDELTAWQGE